MQLIVHMALGATLLVSPAVLAQSYPNKPIRLVVGFAPGGSTDVVARLLAGKLGEKLGQQVVVDNRAGAGSNIATTHVARAPADGYTLLFMTSTQPVNVTLYGNLPYNLAEELIGVAPATEIPSILVVHPSLPARTVKELIAVAKAQPGRILYASASVGSGSHLQGEMFKAQNGVDMTHIPYKGSGPAITDLLGGQVSLMFSTASSVHPFVLAGRLRAIAITATQRHPTLPNVPTVAETIPGFEGSAWNAMFAPRTAPRDIVERLNQAVVAIAKAQDFRTRMASQGYDAESSTPQQLTARVQSELARFGKLINSIGLKDEK